PPAPAPSRVAPLLSAPPARAPVAPRPVPPRLLAPLRARLLPGAFGGSRHALDVEVFDGDQVVLAHQPGGLLVQEVLTCVPYLAVGDRDPALGLAPVVGPALFAGLAPLVTGQVLGLALQVARGRNGLAVEER